MTLITLIFYDSRLSFFVFINPYIIFVFTNLSVIVLFKFKERINSPPKIFSGFNSLLIYS
jgi:hypothetical protein